MNDINLNNSSIISALNNKIDLDFNNTDLSTIIDNTTILNQDKKLSINKLNKEILTTKNLPPCVLSIPKRITLYRKNLDLILEKGSILTIPNGIDEEGNLLFIYKTIDKDIIYPKSITETAGLTDRYLIIDSNNSPLGYHNVITSDIQPTTPTDTKVI